MSKRLKGTQLGWAKRQFLAGKSISHLDLLDACGWCGGWRLAALVYKLRLEGWPIESWPMPNPGPNTDLNPPVVYRLKPGWRPGDPVQQELPLWLACA